MENKLKEGEKAPEFNGTDAVSGKKFSLEDYNDKTIFLYFFPGDTEECTIQACNFRNSREEVTELGIEVVGVTGMSEDQIKEFSQRHNLEFPIISDSNKEIADKYGVFDSEGDLIRTTFIIADGKIERIMRNVDDVERHVEHLKKRVKEGI